MTPLIMIAAFSSAADGHWNERNVPSTCGKATHSVATLTNGVAQAYIDGSCRIEYDAAWLSRQVAVINDPTQPRWGRRAVAKKVCAVEEHEEGHLRGKQHEDTGVMSIDPEPSWRCKVAVKMLIQR